MPRPRRSTSRLPQARRLEAPTGPPGLAFRAVWLRAFRRECLDGPVEGGVGDLFDEGVGLAVEDLVALLDGGVRARDARDSRLPAAEGGEPSACRPPVSRWRPRAGGADLRLPGLRRATVQPAALDLAPRAPRPPGDQRRPPRAARPARPLGVGGAERRERVRPRARQRAAVRRGGPQAPTLAPAAGGGVACLAEGRRRGPGACGAAPSPGAPLEPGHPRARGRHIPLGPRRALHALLGRSTDASKQTISRRV